MGLMTRFWADLWYPWVCIIKLFKYSTMQFRIFALDFAEYKSLKYKNHRDFNRIESELR